MLEDKLLVSLIQKQFGGDRTMLPIIDSEKYFICFNLYLYWFLYCRCSNCGTASKRLSRFYELDLNIQGHMSLNQYIKEFLKVRFLLSCVFFISTCLVLLSIPQTFGKWVSLFSESLQKELVFWNVWDNSNGQPGQDDKMKWKRRYKTMITSCAGVGSLARTRFLLFNDISVV